MLQVTLPGTCQAFALIYSVEDPGALPGARTGRPGVGAQVMGPDDSYLCQYSPDTSIFWADPEELSLGACFQAAPGAPGAPPTSRVGAGEFGARVALGFQAGPTWHQGALEARDAGTGGSLRSTVGRAEWAFEITPEVGWGGDGGGQGGGEGGGDGDDPDDTATPASPATPTTGRQKATAGWLAALPVFEPHWQVLMARGRATGWLDWGGRRYEFRDAPAYAEKNWGGGFPSKWWWVQARGAWGCAGGPGGAGGAGRSGRPPPNPAPVHIVTAPFSPSRLPQCDAFDNDPTAALTAVGALRSLPSPPGLPAPTEAVGMVGLHWRGRFFELVPWEGEVEWRVAPWGRWTATAAAGDVVAEMVATCAGQGSPLRAPTADRGLALLCRDSFAGELTVTLYSRDPDTGARGPVLATLSSTRAAVEVGGGPWVGDWAATARMREPFRSLVRARVDPQALAARLPPRFRPPGL